MRAQPYAALVEFNSPFDATRAVQQSGQVICTSGCRMRVDYSECRLDAGVSHNGRDFVSRPFVAPAAPPAPAALAVAPVPSTNAAAMPVASTLAASTPSFGAFTPRVSLLAAEQKVALPIGDGTLIGSASSATRAANAAVQARRPLFPVGSAATQPVAQPAIATSAPSPVAVAANRASLPTASSADFSLRPFSNLVANDSKSASDSEARLPFSFLDRPVANTPRQAPQQAQQPKPQQAQQPKPVKPSAERQLLLERLLDASRDEMDAALKLLLPAIGDHALRRTKKALEDKHPATARAALKCGKGGLSRWQTQQPRFAGLWLSFLAPSDAEVAESVCRKWRRASELGFGHEQLQLDNDDQVSAALAHHRLRRLQSLTLGASVTWQGLTPLRNSGVLSTLRELSLRAPLVGDFSLWQLTNLSSLTALEVRVPTQTIGGDDRLGVSLAQSPLLHSVKFPNMRGSALDAFTATRGRHAKPLRALAISGHTLSAADFERVCTLSELTQLDLSSAQQVNAEFLAPIRKLGQLQQLDLSETKLAGHFALSPLSVVTSLTELQLNSLDLLKEDALLALLPLLALRVLSLRRSKLVGVHLKELRALPALQMLSLRGSTELNDEGVTGLAKLAQLTSLDLADCERCKFTHKAFLQFGELRALHSFELDAPSAMQPENHIRYRDSCRAALILRGRGRTRRAEIT